MTKSHAELRSIRDSVALVGRLSDSLVRIGPFSLGIDGVLSWAPGLGDLYSAVAGGFIVVQGARAGAPGPVLGAAALLIGCRTLVGAVPIAGSAFADFFTAHKWAAAMIVRALDERLGVTSESAQPVSSAPRPPQYGRERRVGLVGP
ncbi:DUF4112 domain-containing protein [Phenylobacterium sp.]|jgi:hypothetical protein|uniref:DUF4112 domain-containing protein n=1 Tax=Phenylobacterium sp. TaxID=1871053 RepID=UPI002E3697B2|nr:DUF4112 domain-containing protein [Phenylobacterium sp.]HEX3367633.1 DUF4112 domain-containing protein [Phenylobacterium sp.]